MVAFKAVKLCGWKENRTGIREFAKQNGNLFKVASKMKGGEQRDALLFQALLRQHRKWRRGSQGIGDCFAPGTVITGPIHTQRVEDVMLGDFVYTSDGRITQVISKKEEVSNKPLVTIHAWGALPLQVTADHLVQVYRLGVSSGKYINKQYAERERSRRKIGGRPRRNTIIAAYESRTPIWVKAGDLRRGDCLLTPLTTRNIEPRNNPFGDGEDCDWVLGLFLGDGCASGGSVEFAMIDEGASDRLETVLQACGFNPKRSRYRKKGKAWRIRVNCKPLVTALRAAFYDKRKEKVFPRWAVGNFYLLDGLMEADGCVFNGERHFDSTSASLAMGVRDSLIALGETPCIAVGKRSKKTYRNARKRYRVSVYKSSRERVWRDEQYMCQPIRKVTFTEGPHKVYDIGVASPCHSLIADGVAAHNCVGWGAELSATMLMAVESCRQSMVWHGEAAVESIYGGCRVEALNKKRGGRSDGAFGYAAAKWLREYGVLLRKDYSEETGNREHDLRKYDANKSKEWGDYGNGGSQDKGKLDELARLHPIEHVTQVSTVEEAIAALQNYYPISIASMAGFGDMVRNSEGMVRLQGEWAHQMMLGGIIWRNGKPRFRVFQSWGDSCSGPDPEMDEWLAAVPSFKIDVPKTLLTPDGAITMSASAAATWNPISACSWWIDEKTLAYILRTGDCWTYAGVQGFEPRDLDPGAAIDRIAGDLVL